jgi:hypothetical protein
MSDLEEFLARWSRRKRQGTEKVGTEKVAADKVEDATTAAESGTPARTTDGDKAPDRKQPLAGSSDSLFDPTTLPSIESITAETDIRAFLTPGVPAELTRAALRRAWAADPKIRDFVGLADYAWDFHAPGAMAGFGPLEMTDELRREIVGMFNRSQSPEELAENAAAALPEKADPTSPRPILDDAATPTAADKQDETPTHRDSVPCSKENIAVQNQLAQQQGPQINVQRSHGRALPKS